MQKEYIVSIDQSTQGTKALLFDEAGHLLARCDKEHRQIINEAGWVSHDPVEIYTNVREAVRNLLDKTKIDPHVIRAIGISNQRETSLVWNKETGKPIGHAIVWQCARASELCERICAQNGGESFRRQVFTHTGIVLSPYFPAAKWAWLLENEPEAASLASLGKLCFGTIDTWLVYCMTNGTVYKTDYSNASRTQLYHIFDKRWDAEIAQCFHIDAGCLPQVCDSDSLFGHTDLGGVLPEKVPIHSVLGDSHGALFGQGCVEKGMAKCTYGTGSSVMMNTGDQPVLSDSGLVTSLAWGMNGHIQYVLEGNINDTGAIITWMKDKLELIENPRQTQKLCEEATKDADLFLVPAFSGLGAPYWTPQAQACIIGMKRSTGRKELVRAGIEAIGHQIADIAEVMRKDMGTDHIELRTDGGPTSNAYLMQFQADMLRDDVLVADVQELSGIGAAYAAGIGCGMYDRSVLTKMKRTKYTPHMSDSMQTERVREKWKRAVKAVIAMYEQ